MDDPNWWRDPDSAWWAKLARADEHIGAFETEVSAYLHGGGFRVEDELGGPYETVYRLRLSQPIPVRLGAIIGDALHNLRSALDYTAFELARRHVGRDLTPTEEEATEFPVSGTPEWFEKFFAKKGRSILYGPRERDAMRPVQPGAIHDEAVRLGVESPRTRGEAVEWDLLWLLNRLSNIDKHRRLHVTVAWPDLVHWGSDGPSHRRWRYGTPPYDDGAVLGYLVDDPDHPEPPATIQHDMDLRIPDRIAGTQDVAGLLHALHGHVVWAVHVVFGAWVAGR